jgi:hypothetical protein
MIRTCRPQSESSLAPMVLRRYAWHLMHHLRTYKKANACNGPMGASAQHSAREFVHILRLRPKHLPCEVLQQLREAFRQRNLACILRSLSKGERRNATS